MPTRRFKRVELKRAIGLRKAGQPGNDLAGVTIDFSPDGCAVQHQRLSLHCGTRVKLRIALPDRAESVEIDHAIVSWVKNEACGIRFMALKPDDHTRIKMVYETLLEAQGEEAIEEETPAVISLKL